ncbi:alpha-glucosidase family protein [Rhodoferax sp. TS-BS-61-7]|uniref:alpha-glucosidase family protein n=1 Tax=Rhodoferax sp. TS-BS-61-7 TaxID=2094194 RepID=UPI000CF63DEB|nr:alpha-glucosidase family protein [Rhodoferax sp. TS-BS-61-7]PQA77007.1 alpha-glucosidase [Rhodoferax sp. TS-BS-61-7]
MTKASNDNWWRGGVIYQIYPRSFADSNGDGIGDLDGITAKLDYVAALGADGIWLSPFFKSPMKDFGYDVSDYCDVDPMFGTVADFRKLVDRAHALGLKVMIDQVLSHSSDQHPWFVESRSSLTNPKADWYVWADAKSDGTPPNNWLSIFGGSAWQWDTRRCQYYMHNFLTSQPDLNFHSPEVQNALLDTVKFWLDLGVDGYRLDTANFYFHDAQLRSNPARGRPDGEDPAVNAVNPYGWQWHQHDKSQPENLAFLRRLRALLDQYPNTTMVGEIGDDDGLARVAEYTSGGDKLHMAYCFDLLGTAHSAAHFRGFVQRFEEVAPGGWPCWALSNHDVVRVASRWGQGTQAAHPELLRLGAALQMSLRGSPCIYQGDELGLPEADIAFEDLQDPYGITMWPEFKGRDGCRTAHPWSKDSADLGFSSAAKPVAPWLPVIEPHRALAVDVQERDAGSLLNFYHGLLRWRKNQPALVSGTLTVLPAHPQVLAFVRAFEGQQVLCVFNFSDTAVQWEIPATYAASTVLAGSGLADAPRAGNTLQLAPWGGAYYQLG